MRAVTRAGWQAQAALILPEMQEDPEPAARAFMAQFIDTAPCRRQAIPMPGFSPPAKFSARPMRSSRAAPGTTTSLSTAWPAERPRL